MGKVTTKSVARSSDANDYKHYSDYVQPSITWTRAPDAWRRSRGPSRGLSRKLSAPVPFRAGRLIESIRSVLDSELLQTHFQFPEGICPVCKGTDCIRHGRSKLEAQHWKCKRCGRVHNSGGTGTILSRSKLDHETWMRYAECFVDRLSDARASERLCVCNKTAWFMRIRTLEALYRNLPAFQVKERCGAELDELFFRESFKGTRFEGMEYMPREPRTEDGYKVKQVISDDHVCIVTAVNDAGDFFFAVSCRGALTCDIAYDTLKGRILSDAIVNTDKHKAHHRALEDLSVAAHIATEAKEHRNLDRIDEIQGDIRTFMRPFRGVSTRRLHLYLAWYKWLRAFSHNISTAAKQIVSGDYEHTWASIGKMDSPFRSDRMEPTKLPA